MVGHRFVNVTVMCVLVYYNIVTTVCVFVTVIYLACVFLCMCAQGCVLTKFDGSVHAQQHVVTLDVPVDNLVCMEELQSLQTLGRKGEERHTHTHTTPPPHPP